MKQKERHTKQKTTAFQEKHFHKNCWKFSKKVVNGTFGVDEKKADFTKAIVDNFYPQTYSLPKVIDLQNPISPESPEYIPFDTSPIKPKESVVKVQTQMAFHMDCSSS